MFGRRGETSAALCGEPAFESSACTGETLIGLRGEDGRLHEAVVVRSRRDVEDFCKEHRIPLTDELLGKIPARFRV